MELTESDVLKEQTLKKCFLQGNIIVGVNHEKKSMVGGTRRWLSQFSMQLQLMSHDLTVCGFETHIDLCVDSWEPGACFGFCVSLCLCPYPARALSLKNE